MPRIAAKEKERDAGLPLGEPAPPAPDKKGTEVATRRPKTDVAIARPVNFLEVIMRAASDPKVDPGKMRELLEMQKEIAAEEARRAFTAAFMALTDELPEITADRKIEIRAKDAKGERTGRILQSTPFATYNNIWRVIKAPLKKHGFTLSFSTEPAEDGRLIVVGYLDHVGGHQRVTKFPLPAETSGSKNNLQGWGSSQSYGMRYGLRALLNIITHAPEDADTHGAAPEDVSQAEPEKPQKITLAQSTELVKKIAWCGVGLEGFLTHYKIGAVIDLHPGRFDEAITACETYAKNNPAKVKKAVK